MIEGKFKEDFEVWYEAKAERSDHVPPLNVFYELSASLQWGMYVDFINTKKQNISISGARPQRGMYKDEDLFVARSSGALISHEDALDGIFYRTVKDARKYSLIHYVNLYNKYN